MPDGLEVWWRLRASMLLTFSNISQLIFLITNNVLLICSFFVQQMQDLVHPTALRAGGFSIKYRSVLSSVLSLGLSTKNIIIYNIDQCEKNIKNLLMKMKS